jgi:hypothetical protein
MHMNLREERLTGIGMVLRELFERSETQNLKN